MLEIHPNFNPIPIARTVSILVSKTVGAIMDRLRDQRSHLQKARTADRSAGREQAPLYFKGRKDRSIRSILHLSGPDPPIYPKRPKPILTISIYLVTPSQIIAQVLFAIPTMPFDKPRPRFTIRPMKPEEAPDVAALIFHSTNHWYESHGRPKIFNGEPEDCLVFTEVYEDLDPGCCLVAIADEDHSLLASCFYHPRETHMSLGIMNSSPQASGKGIAKALLTAILSKARTLDLPTRLVSSALNLDSFSLYTRHGFVPYLFFQDMVIDVPANGLGIETIRGINLRAGQAEDVESIDALEQSIWNTSRSKDWQHFAENRQRIWSLTVAEDDDGQMLGALASVNHPGCEIIGPGLATNENVAKLMIQRELNQHRGNSPVVIVPSDKAALVESLYNLGARNCELHVAQCLGDPPKIKGVVLPTFMPETA